jgi:GT2 family glycosyltransferase
MGLEVAVLIPWRAGDELREQSWDVVRPYIERLGWPLHCGDRDGPWSRAAAINAAAADAGAWDVAVIIDADTIPPPDLDAAVKLAHETAGAIRPHDHLYRLTPSGNIAVARGGLEALEQRHYLDEYPGGGMLVISRSAWEATGGPSEKFIGWGHEDTEWNMRLVAFADWDRIPGEAYHLWHPDSPKRTREYLANRKLLMAAQYKYARQVQQASQRKGVRLEAIL